MGSSFAAVRELFWGEIGTAGEAVWDGAARLAVPVFEAEGSGSGGDQDVAASVLHGLYWLVAGLAERRPLVLLVDDGQWLDSASARFLTYLARRVDSLPVLIVVAIRGGDRSGAVSTLAPIVETAVGELRVGPLSMEASGTVVRSALGARVDEELCRSCHAATGGNPFYLRELTAALLAESSRPTIEAAERVRALGAGTVSRSVLLRLARLGAECEQLAQAVTVLGSGCTLRQAAILAGLERDRAETAADSLRAADLFAEETALSFVHPIVSEALTAQLPPSRRAGLHAEAARLLADDGASADRVSAHLIAAEPYGRRWVVDVLRRAARDALARGAPEAAATYLRRALAEPPVPEARLEVMVELGRAERLLPGEHEFTVLREALSLALDPQQRAEIALELALGLFAVVRSHDGLLVVQDALEHERSLDPATVDLLETALIGGGLDELRATPVLLARAERHFGRIRRGELHDPRMLAVLAVLGVLTGAPAQDCASLARQALGDERLLEQWLDYGFVTAAWTLCASDCLEESAQAIDAGIAEAQRRGLAPMFMQLAVNRAEIALRTGDLDLAALYAERGFELGRELGAEHVALLWLPIVLLERGEWRSASQLVEAAELSDSILRGSFGVSLLAHRGRVRIAAGEPQRGVDDLLDAQRRMVAAGWQLSVSTDWAQSAALALTRLGRHDEAVQLAERELAEAVAFGAPRRHGIALSICGLLEPGNDGLARLQRAVEILERTPAQLEYARALINLGEGLRTRGQREPARDVLTKGIELAHRCGAGMLVERGRSELVASGARPRRTALSGPDALTPAELRTAQMAAGGLSNREIAQALFVSSKTVEAQLSQAYAKLSIHTRRELAAALARDPQDPN